MTNNKPSIPTSLVLAYGVHAGFTHSEAGWSDPHGIVTIG